VDIEERMEKCIVTLKKNLATIRAGRANAEILDRVRVPYYGTEVPLNQVASVSVPDSHTIQITPFDRNIIGDIEKAIMKSDVGLTPTNLGHNIRLAVPMLTEERRRDLDKIVKKTAEESRIAVRNVRRDILDQYKKEGLSDDELKGKQDEVQKVTDSFIEKIDQLTKAKEKEIMEV